MSLSPHPSEWPDPNTAAPDASCVKVAKTFWSVILGKQIRKRRRHRLFRAQGHTLVAPSGSVTNVPTECTLVGHLCAVEVNVKPTPGGGSVCRVDMHEDNVHVVLWTTAGPTMVNTSATVRTRTRIACIGLEEAPQLHAAICSSTCRAGLDSLCSKLERPGVSVWAATLPAGRCAALTYNVEVGWECTTCSEAWPTAAGLLAHLHLPPTAVYQLRAGAKMNTVAPTFKAPAIPDPRQYAQRVVNSSVLKGRLTALLRGTRPAVRAPQPRLTIEPHW
jgi:hypothetical protein